MNAIQSVGATAAAATTSNAEARLPNCQVGPYLTSYLRACQRLIEGLICISLRPVRRKLAHNVHFI